MTKNENAPPHTPTKRNAIDNATDKNSVINAARMGRFVDMQILHALISAQQSLVCNILTMRKKKHGAGMDNKHD